MEELTKEKIIQMLEEMKFLKIIKKNKYITALLIPLPPTEEQRRIVEKLDKILPLCEEEEELEKEIA